jgi:acetyltransferase
MKIGLLTSEAAAARRPELGALLVDAVQQGASIGFVLPFAVGEIADYWRKVRAEVAAGSRVLVGAYDDTDLLIGSAQLVLESRRNGLHRAEVQKVMVRSAARGQGVGRALMARVEAEARVRGRVLLFLDTSEGEAGAGEFYRKLGYTHAGGIPRFAASPDGHLETNAIFYKELPVTVWPAGYYAGERLKP